MPVQAPFLDQVQATQVRVRVTQSGPPDQALDLGVGERGVGLVHDQLDPVLERHPQHQGLVLGLDRLQQRGRAHLAQLPLGLDIDPGHRAPPPA